MSEQENRPKYKDVTFEREFGPTDADEITAAQERAIRVGVDPKKLEDMAKKMGIVKKSNDKGPQVE